MGQQGCGCRELCAEPDLTPTVQYPAHGAVRSAVYGSGLTDTWTFDPVRLQPLELKTTAADQSVKLDLKYWYCAGQAPGAPAACSSNNGNVQAAGIGATGGLNTTQVFSYDTAGRLATAQESSGANWAQTYSYDIWGNRAVAGTIWNPMSTSTDLSKYSNNQWIRGAGDQYDAAGNQTGLASNNAVGVAANLYHFDAENG